MKLLNLAFSEFRSPGCTFLQAMKCGLMPGTPLFIFSHICSQCLQPQLQGKARALLWYLMSVFCLTLDVELATPGLYFAQLEIWVIVSHWTSNFGITSVTAQLSLFCFMKRLVNSHVCRRADSVLVWVYFALDELLFFIRQKPRGYHRSNTRIFEKFLFLSQTSSSMKKF